MIHLIAIFLLAVFLMCYGFDHATNFEFVWMNVIGALAALFSGVLFLIEAIMGVRRE